MSLRCNNVSGTGHKDGSGYNRNHNDRSHKMDHMDPERTPYNLYYTEAEGWHYGFEHEVRFSKEEDRIFDELYADGLKAQNDRSLKARHPDRVKTMKQWMNMKNKRPQETLIYVGNMEDYIKTKEASSVIFEEGIKQLIEEEKKMFPNMRILDVAIHVDENGAPHAHIRRTWFGHDKDGNPVPSMSKAFKEMGIEPLSKVEFMEQHGYPKEVTEAIRAKIPEGKDPMRSIEIHFSAIEREMQLEIFSKLYAEKGVTIERIAEESHNGKDLLEWQIDKDKNKLQEVQLELEDFKKELRNAKNESEKVKQEAKQEAKQIKEKAQQEAEEKLQKTAQQVDSLNAQKLSKDSKSKMFNKDVIEIDRTEYEEIKKMAETNTQQAASNQMKQNRLDQKERDLVWEENNLKVREAKVNNFEKAVNEEVERRLKPLNDKIKDLEERIKNLIEYAIVRPIVKMFNRKFRDPDANGDYVGRYDAMERIQLYVDEAIDRCGNDDEAKEEAFARLTEDGRYANTSYDTHLYIAGSKNIKRRDLGEESPAERFLKDRQAANSRVLERE